MKNIIFTFFIFVLFAVILVAIWPPVSLAKQNSINCDNSITLFDNLNISYPNMIKLNFDGNIYYDFYRHRGGRIRLYVFGKISQQSLNNIEKMKQEIRYFPASILHISCVSPPESVRKSLGLLQGPTVNVLRWSTESEEPVVLFSMMSQGYALTIHILPSTRAFVMQLISSGRK